ALHELGHHSSTSGSGSKTGTLAKSTTGTTVSTATSGKPSTQKSSTTGAHHEDQGQSDRQMRQAQESLRQALSHLGDRHHGAHPNIQSAIGEIDQAIASRHNDSKTQSTAKR